MTKPKEPAHVTLTSPTEDRDRANRAANHMAAYQGPIDITGIDKAKLLAALHNNTMAVGFGNLQDIKRDLTVEEAQVILDKQHPEFRGCFDYLLGRPIKVDIREDFLDPRLYDRDAGVGKAAEIVAGLRGS